MSSAVFNILYLVELLMFCWFSYRYRYNATTLLIVVLFFAGPFSFFIPQGAQYVRLITFIWAMYLLIRDKLWKELIVYRMLLISFSAFSIYYVLDNILFLLDSPVQTLSQYSKYFIPFLLLLSFFRYAKRNPAYLDGFNKLFFELIVAQITITIVKAVLLRFHFWEGAVGTFGDFKGGGSASAFPLVVLCWFALNTNMEIKNWKKWVFLLGGMLLLGIMAGKRAVILLFPLLFVLLSTLVSKQKYFKWKQLLYILSLAPLLFYFGLRLTPTLNPEKKVWGSFDPEYAWNYAMDYSLGKEDAMGNRGVGKGRVGANLLLWKYIKDTDNYTDKSWFGYGVTRIYSHDASRYRDVDYNFGADHRGSLTGIFLLYIAIGIIGIVLCIIYYWFLFSVVPYQRLRWVLFGLIMFDFIFYNNTMMREPAIHIVLMFCIVYSSRQYTNRGEFIGEVLPYFDKKKSENNKFYK